MPDSVPKTPAEIPGLGPIRLRSLHKLGFETVESLKTATMDALIAVPGITDIKARHIKDYLAPFSLDRIRAAAAAHNQNRASKSALTQWEALSHPVSLSPLTLEAARSLGAVIKILTGPNGAQLRNRLILAFERYGQECQALIVEAVTVPDRDAEKALRRMRKATESLLETARHQEFDKKDQGRVADELAELSSWIAGLRVESLTRSRRVAKDTKDA